MAKRPKSTPPDETRDGREAQTLESAQQAEDMANASEQGASDAREKSKAANDDDTEVIRTDDGGAILRKKTAPKKKLKHFCNLAEDGDDDLLDKLDTLCQNLWQEIDNDIQASTKAVQKYAEAIGDSGVTGKAPGGAAFAGASTANHPVLGEVCADYTARVSREMLPPGGPAKPHVEGQITKEKYDRAKRVARFINWQWRMQMRNSASEMEQCFAQQPFQGASYIKIWREGKKPMIAFVPYDKVHRPPGSDDFYTCERITHELNISARKLKTKQRRGLYADIELGSPTEPEVNKAEATAQKAEGVSTPNENIDDVRTLYEVSCFWDGENDDGIDMPYIVTFDKDTKTPLGCYRNWEEDDEEHERLDFLYEFGFWPFRDGKPIGLAQMLSGLPRAATGAMRALLDSALAATVASGYKLKGGQSGTTNSPSPGEVVELENATAVDDIRKLFMQTEMQGPSPTLFSLLGFLVDAAKGVVRTTFDDIVGKGRQDIPVGTMMMLVDEGTVVYSSIFGRQHRAMARVLQGLYRINAQIVDNVKFSDKEGDDEVTKYDFEGDSIVVPTSDPRINSDTQRWTRATFLAQRAADPTNVGLYNKYETEKMLLEAGSFENIDVILVKPKLPSELSAVNENVAASLGTPITAFPDQNHLAHLEVHADFVKSPVFGMSQAFQPAVIPAMLQHFKEHMVMEYAAEVMKLVDGAITEVLKKSKVNVDDLKALFVRSKSIEDKLSVVDMMRLKDPDLSKGIDLMFAAASAQTMTTMEHTFQKISPMLQQLQQQAQQFKPPQPMDPTQAGIQVATLTTSTQKEIAAQKAQADMAKTDKQIAADAEKAAQDRALDTRALDQKDVTDKAKVAQGADATDQRHQMNIEDNKTALTIVGAELAAGKHSNISTGTGINPTGH